GPRPQLRRLTGRELSSGLKPVVHTSELSTRSRADLWITADWLWIELWTITYPPGRTRDLSPPGGAASTPALSTRPGGDYGERRGAVARDLTVPQRHVHLSRPRPRARPRSAAGHRDLRGRRRHQHGRRTRRLRPGQGELRRAAVAPRPLPPAPLRRGARPGLWSPRAHRRRPP